MSDDAALALIRLLAAESEMSLPRAAKRLSLSASELQRLLVALGDDPRFDGLDLVAQRRDGERLLLRLTERGRALCASGVSAGLRAREALHIGTSDSRLREEWVIEETPVALLYNDLSFAVMMTTPADLEDFALGFAICEGIVATAEEFSLVDIVRSDDGIALHAAIPQHRYDAIERRQRGLEGRSGCGLCGTSSLQAALRPARKVGTGPKLGADRIHDGLARLARQQPLNARSGGVHAAGFVDGDHLLVREDVGRHNAVDKLIGAMLRSTPRRDPNDGFLAITSRASYEIVHKAANAGIAVVAAMSAPTDLAIRHAEAAGLTLIAFARDGRMNVYCGRERLNHV